MFIHQEKLYQQPSVRSFENKRAGIRGKRYVQINCFHLGVKKRGSYMATFSQCLKVLCLERRSYRLRLSYNHGRSKTSWVSSQHPFLFSQVSLNQMPWYKYLELERGAVWSSYSIFSKYQRVNFNS